MSFRVQETLPLDQRHVSRIPIATRAETTSRSWIHAGLAGDKNLGAFYSRGQVAMRAGSNLIDSRRKLDSGEPRDLVTQLPIATKNRFSSLSTLAFFFFFPSFFPLLSSRLEYSTRVWSTTRSPLESNKKIVHFHPGRSRKLPKGEAREIAAMFARIHARKRDHDAESSWTDQQRSSLFVDHSEFFAIRERDSCLRSCQKKPAAETTKHK